MAESFWKKEISFGRKPKGEEQPTTGAEVAPAVKAVLEPQEAVAVPEPATPAEPEQSPVAEAEAPASTALPGVTGDYGWLTTSFDPNDLPDEMPTIVAPLVSLPAQPVSVAQPVPTVEAPAPQAPPAPAAEDAAGASGPFWKKELSFSRRAKAPKQPKAAKEPKQSKARKEKVAKGASAPFWKKELSFARGAKMPKPATAVEAVATEALAQKAKTPFWKLELKRPPKGEKPEQQPKAAKQPRQKKQKSISAGAAKNGLVGLKIGASQVAAARVSNNGSPELLQIARVPLAEGIVVGGELRDVGALAETLKELFAKHKLPKRGVRLGIANNRIGVRTFEIAGINDEAQLANAIRFRAQETLPIPLEEAVLDWQVLSERTDENGLTTRRVLLVVAYRELVDQYVLACKMAGIRLSGIDLEAFAMLRALTTPRTEDSPEATAAQVLVNVGHDRSTFAVTDGTHCEFTRVLGWGGQSLTAAIAGKLEIEADEATEVKHQLSLVASAVDAEGVDPATLAAAREAVKTELQSFARELVSSLRFYQNQPGSLGIGEVILTGGTAHLPGFGEEMYRLIGVPVRVGDPLNRIKIPKKFRQSEDYSAGSLTVAIGLGIEV